MILDNIEAELEKHDLLYRGICHDCGTHVEVSIVVNEKDEIEITGGAIYKIKQGFGEEMLFFKCDECHKEDRTLRNLETMRSLVSCCGVFAACAAME